jgi:hypothetical protein
MANDIDSKACYDCRNGFCSEHGTRRTFAGRKLTFAPEPPGGNEYLSMQPACARCGGLQNVVLLRHGWACDFCLGGDTLPDYEALGYPETGAALGDLDYAAYCVGFASRGIAASVMADELNAIQKDIRSDTDKG